ncbi:hypothetical protein [Defluviimonas sp. SAOS-178_SWC]|uniref:hypothetical protein n=1 Tax=Defluviimonas sp. SAOS-178_SWC TaxID=3121287 RepID=UPI003221AA0C
MFADLMTAALPDGGVTSARAWGWRIEAKAAQRQLLDQAAFRHDNPKAATLARSEIERFDRLVLGL